MGFMSWLLQQFGWRPAVRTAPPKNPDKADANDVKQDPSLAPRAETSLPSSEKRDQSQVDQSKGDPKSLWRKNGKIRLVPNRRKKTKASHRRAMPMPFVETKGPAPYRYARYGSRTGHYLDLSRDGDVTRLQRFDLPVFHTPEELANWIGLPLNRLAWLVHRFSGGRPETEEASHYHFRWVKKRQGGWRLIESPKATLKAVQSKILRELLDNVPVHGTSHGFVKGRSILTNARPHVGQAIVLKFDLANFYTTVSFARVVAIFRSLGYSREVAIWLGLLTTSALPGNLRFQEQGPYAIVPYLRRHLPQGAPTSPALANLSAFGMDLRLAGFAKSYGATFTRYADDLTFSGPADLHYALATIIPLIQQIVRQERFSLNPQKRRVLRAHQRLTVTGVVVNKRTNVARADFDKLKAILTNCQRNGPSTQNRNKVEDFYHHLQGRIAHVSMLNPARGQKLTELFQAIDWTR
ncbi:MAG: reverse transcriptase family protein [Schlesneria sp.]